MLCETLTAIAQSGKQALQRAATGPQLRTLVTQVREWSFAMPDLGLITVANSPVHQVYVGLSRPLAAHLERQAGGQQALLEELKTALVARVPARRPIGKWTLLPPDGSPHVLRGVRSFIVRQQTAAGNLYLMADLASRAEFESLREPGWDLALAEQALPPDLARLDVVDRPAVVRRLTSYLQRCEHDLELLVPGAGDHAHACNAVIVGRQRTGGDDVFLVSIDLDREARDDLRLGEPIEGAFGAAGRVFRFRTHCRGQEAVDLEGLAALPCLQLEIPDHYALDQRRRYFRVQPQDELPGRLACVPAEAAAATPPAADPPRDAVAVAVQDLSFSGAGLVIDGPAPAGLARDGLVHLWLSAGFARPAVLTGLVRRCETRPLGRGRFQVCLGVEFVVRGPEDRLGTQQVRQYVMAQQRRLLASRSSESQAAPV